MLTESQKEYLEKIPKDSMANLKPWDEEAAKFAQSLVKRLEEITPLEVFWEGSLALGIPGENDIDLYFFSEPENFNAFLPKVVSILGSPTYELEDRILWRVIIVGYKIDATMGSKNMEAAQNDIRFFNSLKREPELLQEYIDLKQEDLSAREYYRRKNEFYNQVIRLQ